MHLQRNQLRPLSRSIMKALVDNKEIEVVSADEAALDVEAVLNNYMNQENDVSERARDFLNQRGLPPREFARVKRLVGEKAGIKVGEEALDYVLDQLLEMLMHSSNVEEVFAEDHELRRRMRTFLRDTEEIEQKVEAEVRDKLKHVEEGSRIWQIEYQRLKADIKRRRGL